MELISTIFSDVVEPYFIPENVRQELLLPNSAEPIRQITGGLSGATIWQCRSAQGSACLRVWPASHPSPQHLTTIHRAILHARRAQILCVPAIYANRDDKTFSTDGKSLWELTQWMPGAADYLENPSDQRLRAAMHMLAKLHVVWASYSQTILPSPTFHHRIQLLTHWLHQNDSLRLQIGHELENALATDTRAGLVQLGPRLLSQLRSMANERVPLHFVLRDIWSDHVLFVEDRVSGIIDFGAAREDEPATDVARLLGSLEPFDEERWQQGLAYYHEVNDGIRVERVQILDRAATLLSALQWLQWLVIERRQFTAPIAELYTRWQRLIARLQHQAAS